MITWEEAERLDEIITEMKSVPKYAILLLGSGKEFYEKALELYEKNYGKEG